MGNEQVHRTVEAVWRIEAGRVIAALAGVVRDVGWAEELAQDALVAALEQWPRDGVPANPGAWLTTVGKRRAIDALRRRTLLERRVADLGRDLGDEQFLPDFDAAFEERIDDDLLRLVFTACHPVLSPQARAALTLRMLGGLKTDEIARAFLVPETTVAQRITRAKKTLADAGVPFEVPSVEERGERLASVLEVIYLIFNEGYSATAGDDWMRPALCAEALRLARVLQGLMPAEPEVHGLAALLEIQASRTAARIDPEGEPILLLEQDRGRWDQLLIRRGLAALDQARAADIPAGPYTLQAEIAACHARARTPQETDWARIAAGYAELARVVPSPVVELNRAVAVSFADGPAAGLDLARALADEPALAGYHLLSSVLGDLLAKLGRYDEARVEFDRAAHLTGNERERALLFARAADCARGVAPTR
ncbi:RNA polymerase sigma factor [Micromonospora lupini]|uniref:RNA polymerase sigma factor n=1 Tax=Micromonospora lupini str. Lupac 08 TaxID=1150864 RepID=I0KXD2_9ACTN|nr:RNA polymerase sigma factor [Micromonospora lupini]CCH16229.1 Putative RNA polymerase sigma factor, ECF subfamily [Micromonospora lupini str. Lupac 08]